MIVAVDIAFEALPKEFALRPPLGRCRAGLAFWLVACSVWRWPPLFVFFFFPPFLFLVRGVHAVLGLPWETILAQAIYWRNLSAQAFGLFQKNLTAPSGAEPTTRVLFFEIPLLTIL